MFKNAFLAGKARQQAQTEGLTLLVTENSTGYLGVKLRPGMYRGDIPKPYQARVRRGEKKVILGYFVTAEEAALCVARSPEGQAAAKRSAAPQLSEEEGKGMVPPMPPGTFVKKEDMPSDAAVKDEGVVPPKPMPPDGFVKVEVVVKEEEPPVGRSGKIRSDYRLRLRTHRVSLRAPVCVADRKHWNNGVT